jgi:septal ring factor EnvC (AmiA/AmiB activator)
MRRQRPIAMTKGLHLIARGLVILSLGLIGLVGMPAIAQEMTQGAAQGEAQGDKLEALNDEIRLRKLRAQELTAQAEGLKQQRVRLKTRIIALASDLQNIDGERDRLETRLTELALTENQLDANLQRDRVGLSHMLAGLQAMQVDSPPAFAVHPDDALAAVQGSLVLAGVVPTMRERADKLHDQLSELSAIRRRMDEQSQALIAAEETAAAKRLSLNDALAEMAEAEAQARSEAAKEAQAIARLVREARNLKDLTAKLEKRARARRQAQKGSSFTPPDSRFSAARGLVPLPVVGDIKNPFGSPSPSGQARQGLTIAARPGAQITAPYDGRVLYSGPFRKYGNIVILGVEDRYQMVLAGMSETTTYVGQELLAGEPIGALEEEKSPHGGVSSQRGQLYMELRFDGKPIDPAPWFKTRS